MYQQYRKCWQSASGCRSVMAAENLSAQWLNGYQ